ncbi:MAG: hypothetical protein C4298_01340 [Thermus sp.]
MRKGDLPLQNRLVEVTLRPLKPLLPGPAELAYRLALARGILLPSGAVRVREGEAFVFVVKDGRALKRRVRILAEAGERLAVSGELNPGERVVYPVPESLQEGDKVEVL